MVNTWPTTPTGRQHANTTRRATATAAAAAADDDDAADDDGDGDVEAAAAMVVGTRARLVPVTWLVDIESDASEGSVVVFLFLFFINFVVVFKRFPRLI